VRGRHRKVCLESKPGGPQRCHRPRSTRHRSVREETEATSRRQKIPRVETQCKINEPEQRAVPTSLPMPRQLKKDLDSFQENSDRTSRSVARGFICTADAERLQSIRFGGQHLIAQTANTHIQVGTTTFVDCKGLRGKTEAHPSDPSEDCRFAASSPRKTITCERLSHAKHGDARGRENRPGQTLADCVATSGIVHDLEPCPLMGWPLLRDPKCDFWKIGPPLVYAVRRGARRTALRNRCLDPVENVFIGSAGIDENRSRSPSLLLTWRCDPEASEMFQPRKRTGGIRNHARSRSRRTRFGSAGWANGTPCQRRVAVSLDVVLNCREPLGTGPRR